MNEQERAERDAEWAASDKALNDTANVIDVSGFRQGFHLGWQAARAAGAEREAALREGAQRVGDELQRTADELAEREAVIVHFGAKCEECHHQERFHNTLNGVHWCARCELKKLAEREAAWQVFVTQVRQYLFYLPACHERDRIFDLLRSGPQPIPDSFSKGYKHRHGEPVSDACGDNRHGECTQDLTKCHCTYRSGHVTPHAYGNPSEPIPEGEVRK